MSLVRWLWFGCCLVPTLSGAAGRPAVPTLSDARAAEPVSWVESLVDASGQMGQHVSAALDERGALHVSYYEFVDSVHRRLKHARWNGKAWVAQTVDDSGNVGGAGSLALDGAGRPWISYYDYGTQSLRLARWTGQGWSLELVDGDDSVGQDSSLALDARGEPHISYYDATNQDLKYARRTRTGWIIEVVDSFGDVGAQSSLALDAAGRAHVAYYDRWSKGLKYAVRTGEGWRCEVVDRSGDVGHGSSLALGADGRARISYLSRSAERLKFAVQDARGWQVETVLAVHPGLRTALALDRRGLPHVVLQEPGGRLGYLYRQGDGWRVSAVGNLGEAAWGASLVLDGAGRPVACYAALGDHSVRCARPADAGARSTASRPLGSCGADATCAQEEAAGRREAPVARGAQRSARRTKARSTASVS